MRQTTLNKLFFALIVVGLIGCNNTKQSNSQSSTTQQQPDKITAQDIVDNAIAFYGGANYEQAEIRFKFREHNYRSIQNGGEFKLERIAYNDSIGKITDEVTNSGYRYIVNDEFAKNIADSMQVKFTNSVNSVHYFARLPYGLNAAAVNKELLGIDIVNNIKYYQVKVTFKQEGGGVDFQDIFVYWFRMDNYKMDYLAYSYQTDGGGVRFRAAKDAKEVNGIRFQNYTNYKPASLDVDLADLDQMYANNELVEVSSIILENIEVDLLIKQ